MKPDIQPFRAEDLSGVLSLCEAEGWPTLPNDPNRALAMLTIVDAGGVDAYLSTMAVDQSRRRQGIARLLVNKLFEQSGVTRIDLLAEPGSEAFYDSLSHRAFRGYRIYRG